MHSAFLKGHEELLLLSRISSSQGKKHGDAPLGKFKPRLSESHSWLIKVILCTVIFLRSDNVFIMRLEEIKVCVPALSVPGLHIQLHCTVISLYCFSCLCFIICSYGNGFVISLENKTSLSEYMTKFLLVAIRCLCATKTW